MQTGSYRQHSRRVRKPSLCLRLVCGSGVSRRLAGQGEPVPYAMNPKLTNQESLRAAVDAAAEVLNSAVRPVLLGGVKVLALQSQPAPSLTAGACCIFLDVAHEG